MAARSVTVCVLLYGDYKALAMRCIESIRATEWAHRVNIVIGMNAVCEDTRQYVYGLYGNDPFATIFDSEKNFFVAAFSGCELSNLSAKCRRRRELPRV